MKLEEFIKIILESGIATAPEGATADDLNELEKTYSVSLPESYKNLMFAIGYDCGRFIDKNEYDFYIDSLKKINDSVREDRKNIEEDGEDLIEIPRDVFYILGRYGDSFYYIDAIGGEDSAVWHYNMEIEKKEKRYDSVMDWALALLNDTKVAIDSGYR